jgi:hypothetical protein
MVWNCPKCETNNEEDVCLLCGTARPVYTQETLWDNSFLQNAAALPQSSTGEPALRNQAELKKLQIRKVVTSAVLLALSLFSVAGFGVYGLFICAVSLVLVILSIRSGGQENGCDIAIISITGLMVLTLLLLLFLRLSGLFLNYYMG